MSKVTIVGAGKYGSMTALRVAESNNVSKVIMTDIVEGLPQGLALDINQSRYVEKFETEIIGTNNYQDTKESDVVVITAGMPRKPGMSRMDLLSTNARIVKDVTSNILEFSSNPKIIVVTNPLDQMTTLVSEISGLPKENVIGQAGILDSSRFAYFISQETGNPLIDIQALTLGSHGETMVPVPSQCFIDGRKITELLSEKQIKNLVEKTSKGGAEIVELLKTGSAYFAPASAAAQMVNAIITDSNEVLPVCAWMSGQYGISDVYLGVTSRIGRNGVEEIIELPLEKREIEELRIAAESVKLKVLELKDI